jgi:hypothetical protein
MNAVWYSVRMESWAGWHSSNASSFIFWKQLVWTSAMLMANLKEDFTDLPQSLQSYIRLVPSIKTQLPPYKYKCTQHSWQSSHLIQCSVVQSMDDWPTDSRTWQFNTSNKKSPPPDMILRKFYLPSILIIYFPKIHVTAFSLPLLNVSSNIVYVC